MSLTREKLIQELTDAGLVSADEVTKIESESGSTGIDALLGQLVELGKITRYQADKFGTGNGGEVAFGDYVVIDELGRGGMGTVLRARHRRMDREVAIKVLPGAALDSETAVARFYQEVKVAAQLTHPNIVHAYDAGEHQGFHYLVMEYVRGQDLSKVVSAQGAIHLESAIDYIQQAATGLQYAHRKGVVHRDIKPSNLLLDDENTVKILDMGLARIGRSGLNENAQSMHLTTTGQVMGTVDYMAPEQAEDTRNADHRSDIYSLGCTLFRFVTGAAPYSRDTVVKTILAHREAPVPSLGQGGGPAYQSLDKIFSRMVAKKPEERYQDCQTLLDDLDRARQWVQGSREEQTVQWSGSTSGDTSLPPIVASPSDPAIVDPKPTAANSESTADSRGTLADSQAPASDPDGPTLMPNRPAVPLAPAPGHSVDSQAEIVDQVVEVQPDRSKKLLTWAIIGLVFSIFCGIGGIPGLVTFFMAKSDLKMMDQGKMDDANRSIVYSAMACGLIAAIILGLYVIRFVLSNALG